MGISQVVADQLGKTCLRHWDFRELIQLRHQDIFSGLLKKIHPESRAICVSEKLLASRFLWAISFVLSFGQEVAWGVAFRQEVHVG